MNIDRKPPLQYKVQLAVAKLLITPPTTRQSSQSILSAYMAGTENIKVRVAFNLDKFLSTFKGLEPQLNTFSILSMYD